MTTPSIGRDETAATLDRIDTREEERLQTAATVIGKSLYDHAVSKPPIDRNQFRLAVENAMVLVQMNLRELEMKHVLQEGGLRPEDLEVACSSLAAAGMAISSAALRYVSGEKRKKEKEAATKAAS